MGVRLQKICENMRITFGITNVQSNSTKCSVHVCLGEIYTYIVIQVAQLKSISDLHALAKSFLVWNLIQSAGLLIWKEIFRIPKRQWVLGHEEALNCPGNKCQRYRIHIEI